MNPYLHEGLEMGILLLEVVVSLPPLGHGGAMPDHHCEVAIQQQHSVRSDRSHIQHDWLCLRPAHAVGLHCWLDHGDSITGGFSIQQHPTVGCFIWTVAKDLNSSSSSSVTCMLCCWAPAEKRSGHLACLCYCQVSEECNLYEKRLQKLHTLCIRQNPCRKKQGMTVETCCRLEGQPGKGNSISIVSTILRALEHTGASFLLNAWVTVP